MPLHATINNVVRSVRGMRTALPEQHAGAVHLLAAERAQEVRYEAIHQLEVRRERRRVLLRVVEHFLAVALGIHRRARAAVDEDELRAEDEALALLIRAH